MDSIYKVTLLDDQTPQIIFFNSNLSLMTMYGKLELCPGFRNNHSTFGWHLNPKSVTTQVNVLRFMTI